MTFKEQLAADAGAVFLNPAEFGEIHNVGGKEMTVVIDDSGMQERGKRMQSGGDGVYERRTVVYVSALDFGPLPAIGDILTVDGDTYMVKNCVDEGDIYSIHLEDYESDRGQF